MAMSMGLPSIWSRLDQQRVGICAGVVRAATPGMPDFGQADGFGVLGARDVVEEVDGFASHRW